MALQGVKGSTVGNEKSQKVTIWRELEYGLLAWWYALCGAVPLLKNLGAYFFSLLAPLQQMLVIVLVFLKDFKETGYKTETLRQCNYWKKEKTASETSKAWKDWPRELKLRCRRQVKKFWLKDRHRRTRFGLTTHCS